jgi:hypothetical protein
VHVRRPRLDYESHATGLDHNEVGALLVAAELGPAAEHALVSLLALNGLRVSEATGADIEVLGLERGHRTLGIVRKGGKRLVTQTHQGLCGSPASEASAVNWFRWSPGWPAGGLYTCRLPVGSGGAARRADVHSVHPASRAGHIVGGLAGQGKVSLLPADGHAYADDSGDYSSSEQADGCECDQGGHGGSPLLGWLLAAQCGSCGKHRRR